MHFITLNSPRLIEEVPLFFVFDHSLGARAEICKNNYSEIIWPLVSDSINHDANKH